ncbi:hypothetical protein K443DRAFT_349986 [Laccaria amethystina LaAM-08-1]|uniref:Unplaced genomic scaffold K443scaffold_245, whole genome shotgun sequence n=1 Tax=Laccaria amethystina LaAM-08-1 TaxID=1095629 RepID=A0A0C9X0A1_9AGAR|nr:hypothetical protein K443DRAFT_349986 [Laccaria amethystina LaAM-08-1]
METRNLGNERWLTSFFGPKICHPRRHNTLPAPREGEGCPPSSSGGEERRQCRRGFYWPSSPPHGSACGMGRRVLKEEAD